jgi:tetratricopeptide (TPR) repeat protein
LCSNRAVAYYKLELFRKCLQDCDAVLKLDPKNLRAYLKKGNKNIFILLRHDFKALRQSISVKLNEKSRFFSHFVFHLIGEALHSMGKKEEALKVFKEAASLDGDLEIVAAIHTYLKGGAPPSTTTNDSVSVPSTTKRSSESSTSSALPDEPPPLEKDDEPFPTSSSSSSSSSPHFKLTKRNSDSRHSYVCQNCCIFFNSFEISVSLN